ncbi:MAG: hypothetical protein ACOYT4_00440 [Nanoarchaeota archaeon]
MNLEEQSTKLRRKISQLEEKEKQIDPERNLLVENFHASIFESLKQGEIAQVLRDNYLQMSPLIRFTELSTDIYRLIDWEQLDSCKVNFVNFLNLREENAKIFVPILKKERDFNQQSSVSRDHTIGIENNLIFRAIDSEGQVSNIFFYSESFWTHSFKYYGDARDLYIHEFNRFEIIEADISKSNSNEFISDQLRNFFKEYRFGQMEERKMNVNSLFRLVYTLEDVEYAAHKRRDLFNPRKESLSIFDIEFPVSRLNEFSQFYIRALDSTKLNPGEQNAK